MNAQAPAAETVPLAAREAPEGTLAIGVDIGGTKIAAGVVDEGGHIVARTRRPTPADDPSKTQESIADAVRELTSEYTVVGVGLGAAGFVDEKRSTVMFAPNLAWRDEHLRESLEDRLGMPVIVENDANAAAWAEARFGAARGETHVVILTIGTGIGGGVVLDGKLFRGRYGLAGEIGHFTIVPDGRRCGCGLHGCWEQYGSGRALVLEAQEQATVAPSMAPELLRLAGGRPAGITGHIVTEAARSGDVTALNCFDELGKWLGRGMAALAAILDPGMFVIAGGVCEAGEILRAPTEAVFRKNLTGRGHRPTAKVRIAELGNEAGLVGAADLSHLR
ncbi:ROK family glucokinase [Amycolatopsis sp. NPDC050768]|uniref:ROK family glucokinase n=1 Tax=Amycolatopsis sp. NPDC050768 TaxID=3154839 RepID=UPI0034027166